jgi:uncharacterized protein YdiU (UPF0061 family)
MSASKPYLALLEKVIDLQAFVVAKWMQFGFIHGVMNTDNVSLAGETIDYGPCAFMDTYHPETVFSSIDLNGRYCYQNQPVIAQWNLARFAESLIGLIDSDQNQAIEKANTAIGKFNTWYDHYWLANMKQKIGLQNDQADDQSLIQQLLALMAEHKLDFTNTFRHLTDYIGDKGTNEHHLAHLQASEAFSEWLDKWWSRLNQENASWSELHHCMHNANPIFIPRNHLVENAINEAQNNNDFGPFYTLLDVVCRPYESRDDKNQHAEAPKPEEIVTQTFCGT